MAQRGRPTDYNPGMIDTLIAAAEGDTLGAATIPDIAKVLGVSRASVYAWTQEHKDFLDAIVRVRKMADAEVESALRKRAIGYTVELAEQKVDKDGCVHDLKKDVHVAPDTPAAIFWLKNRDPERWSDKTKVEVTGDFADQVEAYLASQRKDA